MVTTTPNTPLMGRWTTLKWITPIWIMAAWTTARFNLEIQTTNFTFAPETVNQANTPNAGHAHVYANGKKLSRVYGNWFHITGLPAGDHTIMVELNANSHGVIQVDGQPLQVSQTVTVP